MKDEPKIQAAIEAALSSELEEPKPNPKREVPMPDSFTRVEDFLNTPLFEIKQQNPTGPKLELQQGTLLNIVSVVAGLASVSAAIYWYASARDYQRLSADLAGELRFAHQQRAQVAETIASYEHAFTPLIAQGQAIARESQTIPVAHQDRREVPVSKGSVTRQDSKYMLPALPPELE